MFPATLARIHLCLLRAPSTNTTGAHAATVRFVQLHGGEAMTTDIRLAWAKLRDCVLLGREVYRYPDLMLGYHYTKEKALLQQALDESWEGSAHSYDSAQDDRPWH